MAKKVKVQNYTMFAAAFAGGQFRGQRLGQAFINKFYDNTDLVDSKLFYEENKEKAVALIFTNYIEN